MPAEEHDDAAAENVEPRLLLLNHGEKLPHGARGRGTEPEHERERERESEVRQW